MQNLRGGVLLLFGGDASLDLVEVGFDVGDSLGDSVPLVGDPLIRRANRVRPLHCELLQQAQQLLRFVQT